MLEDDGHEEAEKYSKAIDGNYMDTNPSVL